MNIAQYADKLSEIQNGPQANGFRNIAEYADALEEWNKAKALEAQTKKEEKEEKEKAINPLGDLGYSLGSIGLGAFGMLEGAFDYIVGGSASLFGAKEWAQKLLDDDVTKRAQEKLYEATNPGKVGKFLGEVGAGLGQSGLILATSLIPGVGVPLGVGLMTAGAAGRSWSEANSKMKEQGRSAEALDAKTWMYATSSGAIEGALEYLSGAAFKIAGRVANKGLSGALKGVTRSGIVKTMVKDGAGEFLEESVSGILDPILQRMYGIDKGAKIDIKDAIHQGIVGFVSGAVLSGSVGAMNNARSFTTGSKMSEENFGKLKRKAQEIAEFGENYVKDNAAFGGRAAENLGVYVQGITGTYKALNELSKSAKADNKLFKTNILKGELARQVAGFEMTEGFLKSREEIMLDLEHYKSALGMETVADSQIDEWAVLHYVNKLIIPEETYTDLVKKGRVVSGYPQFANYIDTLSESAVKEINELLGIDIKNDSMAVIDNAMRKRAQSLSELSLSTGKQFLLRDFYKVRRADNFKQIVFINNKVVSPEKINTPVKMDDGEVKLIEFEDKRQIAVAKDKNGYTVALSNDKGEIDFNLTSKPMSEKQFNDVIDKVRDNRESDKRKEIVVKEKNGVDDSDAKTSKKETNKKDDLNSSALAPIAYGCYYKSSSDYKLAQTLKDVKHELINNINANYEKDITRGRVLPISLHVFEEMLKNNDLKGLEIKLNDYLILKENTKDLADFMQKNNISFDPNVLIAKANKVVNIVQKEHVGDKYNKHNIYNLSALMDSLDSTIEYIFKGQSDSKYEIVVKDLDYKNSPIVYVIEVNDNKVLNGIKENVNTLVTAYGKDKFQNYLDKMRGENRVIYEKHSEANSKSADNTQDVKLKNELTENAKAAKEQLDSQTINKLEDFGRKIVTARKYLYKSYTLEELNSMNDAEKSKNITRDKLWRKPDYKKMHSDLTQSTSEAVSKIQIFLLNEMRKTVLPNLERYYLNVSDEMYQSYADFVNAVQEFSNGEFSNPLSVVKDLPGFLESKDIASFNDNSFAVSRKYAGVSKAVNHLVRGFINKYKNLGKEGSTSNYYLQNGLGEYEKKGFFIKNESASKDTTESGLINYKRLEHIHREGTDYRNGQNIGEKEMARDRGIESVTFGNWLTDKDRQIELNYVYDALGDLAQLLGIDEKSVALADIKVEAMKETDTLGICLGSNGHGNAGGISAAAHFEPSTNIINMTKKYGAGSLGHEWWHALDAYIARALTNDAKKDSVIADRFYLPSNTKISEAINRLKDSIKYIEKERTVDIEKGKQTYERQIKSLEETCTKYLRRAVAFAKKETLYTKWNSAKKEYDTLDYSKIDTSVIKQVQDILKSIRDTNADSFSDLKALLEPKIKEINAILHKYTGHQVISMAKDGSFYDLVHSFRRLNTVKKEFNNISDKEVVKIQTNYYRDATRARKSGYWAKWEELGARAFASYLSDKARAKGINSDYLSGHGEYNHFAFFGAVEEEKACSYPTGEEATQIYRAFDNLFDVLKEEKLLKAKEYKTGSKKVKYSLDTVRNVETTQDNKNVFVDHRTAEAFANKFIRGYATMSGNAKARVTRTASIGLAYGIDVKDLASMINMSNIMGVSLNLDNSLSNALGVFKVKNNTGYILINPRSKQNALAVMLHEMVHAMSGTAEYKEFKNVVSKFSKKELDIIKKDIVLDKVNPEYEKLEGHSMSAELIEEESLAYFVQYRFYELAKGKVIEKYSKNLSPKSFYQKLRGYVKKMRDTLIEINSPEAKTVNALYKAFENIVGSRVISTQDTYKESVLYTTDNEKVYRVDNDVFKVLNNYRNKEVIAEYLKNNKVVVGNSEIYITRRTRKEYLYSEYTKYIKEHNYSDFKDKIRLVDNIEELLIASDNYVNEGLKHDRKDNFVEFARGDVLLDVFDRKYKADVIVGKTNSGELELYDIVKVRKVDFEYKKEGFSSKTDLTAEALEKSSYNFRISDQNNIVNQDADFEYKKGASVSGRTSKDRKSPKTLAPNNDLTHSTSDVNTNGIKYSLDISFEDGVKDVLRREVKGEAQRRDAVMVLKSTPKLLQDAGLKNLPMLITAKHIITSYLSESSYKDANHHGLGKSILELPNIINNPAIILKSATRNDAVILFGDKFDNKGRLIMSAIKNDGANKINDVWISSNPILSFYGREDFSNFIKNNVKHGNLIYYNKKLVDALQGQGYNCQGSLKVYQSDTILQKINSDVKYSIDIPGIENVLTEMPERAEDLSFFKKPNNEKKEVMKHNFMKWWDRFNTSMINAQHAIEKYANNSLKILSESKYGFRLKDEESRARAESVRGLVQAARTADQAAQYMISTAQYDFKGNYLGDGLAKIFEFTREADGSYNQKYADFQLYLLHKHNIDRLKQGKPIFKDSITAEVSEKAIIALEKANSEFKEKAEAVWAYNQNLLKIKVDAGIISQDSYDYMTKIYPHYVPTHRSIDDPKRVTSVLKGKTNVEITDGIKKVKGSDLEVLPIDEQMAEATVNTIKGAKINQMIDSVVSLAEQAGNEQYEIVSKMKVPKEETAVDTENEEVINPSVTDVKMDQKNAQITFRRNGEKITIKVDADFYRGIENLQPSSIQANWMSAEILRKANSLFKKLVTSWNPLFNVRNATRDIQEATVYTRFGVGAFYSTYAKAVQEIKSNGKYWQEAQAMGILQNSIYSYDSGIQYGKGTALQNGMRKVEYVNNFVEMLPRLTEYMLSRESGLSPEVALQRSADVTTNFARGGIAGKWLNSRFIPFLNPSIQGCAKLFRGIISGDAAKGIASLLIRWLLGGFLITALNDLLNKPNKHYADVSEHDKRNYFLFDFNGDGKFFKLPKGRVTAVAGNAYLTAMRLAKTEKEDIDLRREARELVNFFNEQLTPVENITRNIFSPFIDAKNNKTWYGSDIESGALLNYAPKNRFDERTSGVAIWLGKVMDYSPKKIHYLIDSYSGFIGDILLPLTTKATGRGIVSQNFGVSISEQNKWGETWGNLKERVTWKYNENRDNLNTKALYQFINRKDKIIMDVIKTKKELQMSDMPKREKKEEIEKLNFLIMELRRKGYEEAIEFRMKTRGTGFTEENYSLLMVKTIYEIFGADRSLEFLGTAYLERYEKKKDSMSKDSYIKGLINMWQIKANKSKKNKIA